MFRTVLIDWLSFGRQRTVKGVIRSEGSVIDKQLFEDGIEKGDDFGMAAKRFRKLNYKLGCFAVFKLRAQFIEECHLSALELVDRLLIIANKKLSGMRPRQIVD